MNRDTRSRVLTVVVLAVLGVGLATAGTALGIGDSDRPTASAAAFSVSSDNVTLSDGEQQRTLVENMTTIDTVEIQETDGHLVVNTESKPPLSEDERDRAVELARANETVQQTLGDTDAYEFSVTPVTNVTESTTAITAEGRTIETNASADTMRMTVDVEAMTIRKENGSVTVRREPTYIEEHAIVRVWHTETDDLRYTLKVDLAAERIIGLWNDRP